MRVWALRMKPQENGPSKRRDQALQNGPLQTPSLPVMAGTQSTNGRHGPCKESGLVHGPSCVGCVRGARGVRLFTVPGCPKPTMGNRWIHARAEGMKDGCGGEWPGQSLQNGASSCACLWVEAGEWKHAFSSDGWAGNHAQQRWAAERACWPGCLFPLGFRGLGGFCGLRLQEFREDVLPHVS